MRLSPLLAAVLLLAALPANAKPLSVVAAENFYGDVAQQIGGADGAGHQHPDQSESGPPYLRGERLHRARDRRCAASSIYNGADYDPWMANLLAASTVPDRKVIVVADLVQRKSGDNPHLWYDPATMPALAKALAAEFAGRDPAHKADYESRLQTFLASLEPMTARSRSSGRNMPASPSPRPSRSSAICPMPWASTCAISRSRLRS